MPGTDIYALGCVLYEMLAGEPPYTGPTAQVDRRRDRLDRSGARGVAGCADTVPPAIEAALIRALAKVPADRFAERRGLCGRSSAGAAPLPRSRLGWPRRWRGALWIAGAAGLVLLALAIVLSRHRSAPAPPPGAPIPLAVLPFRALGVAGDSGVLTIGVPDAIITRLAGVQPAPAPAHVARSSATRIGDVDPQRRPGARA